jgi:prophage regulatory protein
MRILRERDVVKKVGLSRMTLWRWSQDGRFPKSRPLGPSVNSPVGWLESQIDEWIEERFQTELSRKLDEMSADNSKGSG